MNVTVPEFNSCTASLKVNEKATKDYIVRINFYIGVRSLFNLKSL